MQDPAHPPAPPAEELDIIGHVANSPPDHPLIHLPAVFGIDLSVSKHVFMLWVVAAILLGLDHDDGAPLHPADAARADRPDERPRDRRGVHP